MTRTRSLAAIACVLAALLLGPGSSRAHHSAANYDLQNTDFALQGTIKSVSFRNPHSQIILLRPDASGRLQEWDVEFSSVNLLQRRGWKFAQIKAGDKVTCIGNPDKSGALKMYLWSIRLADGTSFGK